MANSARRLEVVRNCITYIFDNKMLEAKKVRTSYKEIFVSAFGKHLSCTLINIPFTFINRYYTFHER